MYVAIGERIHAPKKSDRVIAQFNPVYQKHTLRAMLTLRGMVQGPTRKRLEDVMGVSDLEFVVNLLPPDNKIGTWNRKQAERAAEILKRDWLAKEKDVKGIFLLGKKVIEAFTGDKTIEFLEEYWVNDVPCLCLPHPSGRGRWLSDTDRAAKCKVRVAKFYEQTRQPMPVV